MNMDNTGGQYSPGPPINVPKLMKELIVNKEEFKSYILEGKTIPELQKIYECTRATIAHYKREYGFVGLTPNSKRIDRNNGYKHCAGCDTVLSLESFYSNGKSPAGLTKYKPTCISCENSSRKDKYKEKVISYLQRINKKYECEICKFTGIYGSLDFHHTDPSKKSFNIGDSRYLTANTKVFNEKVVPEINKCKLLCPNCHRQEHLLLGQK